MYVSNQVRQRRYLKGRRAAEENAIVQQEVLDGLISKDLGLDATADYMNRVNKRIADRIKKEMAAKNFKDFTTEKLVDERGLMGQEDVDVGRLVSKYKSEPASEDQLRTQAEKQAALDLIALFQQDVKEGRKRQTAIDLKNLNATADYMNKDSLTDYIKTGALSGLLDEFKKIDPKMLSKKAKIVQKDLSNNELKEIFNDEISIILSDNSIPDSKKPNMIKKVVYNILAGGDRTIIDELFKKTRSTQGIKDKDKFMKKQFGKEIVNDLLTKVENAEIEKKNIDNIRDFDKNMREKMNELRAKKISSSPTNTSIMSDAPQRLDLRFGNNPNPSGRPKKSAVQSLLDYETKREGKIGKKLDKGQQDRVRKLWEKLNEELKHVD